MFVIITIQLLYLVRRVPVRVGQVLVHLLDVSYHITDHRVSKAASLLGQMPLPPGR